MNTDGFVSSRFRNKSIRLLNSIHITRAVCVSEQPIRRKLQGYWGRLQIGDVLSPTRGFSSPTETGLFVDLRIYREPLLLYLNELRLP